MCSIVLAYQVHPQYPLLLAANRDEFRARPAAAMHAWEADGEMVAGRDLRAGGTWLGMHRSGRFAALTNYRDMRRPSVGGPSRGALVRQVLESGGAPLATDRYEGFNLLYGPLDALRYHNNITPADVPLAAGVHGLSNALLDTPWPKVERMKQGMERLLQVADPVEELFALMADTEQVEDAWLPDTGLPKELERAMSSVFITGEAYGTRCTTVVYMDRAGRVYLEERTWPGGHKEVFGPLPPERLGR